MAERNTGQEVQLPFPPSASDSVPAPFESSWARSSPHASSLEEEVVRFFVEVRDSLLRYILSQGLSAHDGEGIVQEAFLALFQHLAQGKPRTNLRGWIFRVAHNLALKHRANHAISDRVPSGEGAAESRLASGHDPEKRTQESQRRQKLLAVVNALADSDRNCLHLRAEGLRYREIAEVLGMSLGGVSLALARALSRLREADRDHGD